MAQGFPKAGLFRGKDLSPLFVVVIAVAIIVVTWVYFSQVKDDDDSEKVYKVDITALNDTHLLYPGKETHFAVIVTNLGNVSDEIELEGRSPPDMFIRFDDFAPDDKGDELVAGNVVFLKSGQSAAVIVTVGTFNGTVAKKSLNVVATSRGNHLKTANMWLNVYIKEQGNGSASKIRDNVQANYAGCRVNGHVFDTNLESVARNKDLDRSDNVKGKTSFSPLKVYIGDNDPDPDDEYIQVVEGFWQGLDMMDVGETKVVRLDPARAYGEQESSSNELAGKWLIFEITLVSIDGTED